MNRRNQWLAFLRDEDGPTAVEYAVMLALIVVFCLASIRLFGANTASTFGTIRDSISVFMGS
ncbi:MAG: Flp family type IVb pilin [Planctomycetales bacterium]|nr:Flp family type IVb pilin [Planctomycetales bacterium]